MSDGRPRDPTAGAPASFPPAPGAEPARGAGVPGPNARHPDAFPLKETVPAGVPSQEAARRSPRDERPVEGTGTTAAARAADDLEAIVDRFEIPLLRYAGRIVRDEAAAQDVVQEAFIRFWRGRPSARPAEGKLAGWLYRATHNAAVDYIRRESRRRRLHERQAEEPTMDRAGLAASADEVDARRRIVLEHVDALSAAERQVLVLRIQEGLSYREIAQATRRTEGNVGCLLHHAARHLARHLKKAGVI
jgi:RNA polymerase sigma factor (sigma-70 family)